MRRLVLALIPLLVNTIHAEDTPPDSSSLHFHVVDDLARRFPFEQKLVASPVEARPAEPGQVVVLPLLTVTADFEKLRRGIEEFSSKKAAEKFSWKNGGTILKSEGKSVSLKLKIDYRPDIKKIEIFSLSW